MARYHLDANAVYETCTLAEVADLSAGTPVRVFTPTMDVSTCRWGRAGSVEVPPAGETDAEYAHITNDTLGKLR